MAIEKQPFNPYEQPPLDTCFPRDEPSGAGRGRNAPAVLVPLLLLLAVTGLVVVLLTGVVRFGAPAASGISMAPSVDETQRPRQAMTAFPVETPAVYCCASVKAYADTVIEAKWFGNGGRIAGYKSTFGKMTDVTAAKFMPSKGRVAFRLQRPDGGWETGAYSVRLYLDARQVGEARFTIANSRTAGVEGGTYREPSGAFSILVPEGWKTAEENSLDGALAGFVSEAGPYPPRFAVTLTSYTSVAPTYLNRIIREAGAKNDELFSQYSIGDLLGARRSFNWEFDAGGGQKYSLKSIQAVVQVENAIYSIDCHSTAIDFERNKPVFNAVIDSFR